MQWENLTSQEFAEAVVATAGVGIIPVGVLEPHSAHLPLGTDAFEAHAVACWAAEQESAIVFPFYPYGINHESAHLPGSVVIKRDLVLALLENICDEMARHGLMKIILLNGHGGNRFALPLFVQTLVEKQKPYVVYYADLPFMPDVEGLLETQETGHACEAETSTALYLHADAVKMHRVPPQPFTSLKRNAALSAAGLYSPVDWYAMYPAMYVGDASKATAAKGQVMIQHRIAALVKAIRAVKADDVTPQLLAEFLRAQQRPAVHEAWTRGKE